MSKPLKSLLFTLAVILGILICSIITINLYLQSNPVQDKIQKAVENATGMQLTVGNTSYTPWGGLKLSTVSIAEPETPQTPFAQANSICLNIAPLPLLQKKIQISSITLDKPFVELKQNKALPTPRSSSPSIPNTQPPVPAPQSPSSNLPLSESEPQNLPAPSAVETKYEIEVKKILVENGSISVINEANRPTLLCKNVNATAHVEAQWALTGEISADEVTVGERLFFRAINARFRRSNRHIVVDPIDGKLADGTVTGTLDIDEATRQFTTNLRFNGASIPKLLLEAGFAESNAAGTIDGTLTLKGLIHDKATYSGEGEIHMLNATIEPFSFLKKLGQLLKIEELQLLHLREANAHMLIAREKIFLDKILLQSENLILKGAGIIDFTGDLDINSFLLVNEKIQRNLGGLLGKNFTDSDQEGYKQMEFQITGNIKKPKTDLLEKITGIRLGNALGGLLQNLIGPSSPAIGERTED